MSPRVILIGPPGAGKTAVAAELGELWGAPVRDTDADIEAVAGTDIAAIFLDAGEVEFRRIEREQVARAIAEHDGVLALGGGSILDASTQADLRDYAAAGGAVVYLSVGIAAAAPRVGFNTARPLLVGNPRQRWMELLEERLPIYTSLATMSVDTNDADARGVAERIAEALA